MEWQEEWRSHSLEYSLKLAGENLQLTVDETAHEIAGGEKDIAVYLIANENAVPFYEKQGMKKSNDVMQYNQIDWTSVVVE